MWPNTNPDEIGPRLCLTSLLFTLVIHNMFSYKATPPTLNTRSSLFDHTKFLNILETNNLRLKNDTAKKPRFMISTKKVKEIFVDTQRQERELERKRHWLRLIFTLILDFTFYLTQDWYQKCAIRDSLFYQYTFLNSFSTMCIYLDAWCHTVTNDGRMVNTLQIWGRRLSHESHSICEITTYEQSNPVCTSN
jgi:hypothetical protein